MKTSEVEIDITKLSSLKQFSSFLKAGTIEQLAKETGFICRNSSRLTGAAFLEMMVQHIAPDTEWSLADQCDYLWEQHGIELTKQSLDERYHTFTVSFLKSCYEAVFAQLFKAAIDAIDCSFSGIYLTDSTSFQLPAHLACFYQSNGGDTSGASVKLHQTIELLRFQIKDVLISDGKAADVRYWGKKGFEPEVGSLWIADLGHFSWDVFTRIAHSGSYFLSRYKTGTLLYIKDQEGGFAPLNIEQYVKSLAAQNRVHALEVYFGQEKVKARLICEAVPEEVKQQRLNKYRQLYARQSKGKGRHWEMTPTKERLSGYNLYITNAPAERIKQEDVFLIYGLRWQIELLFKIWKSLLFLDKVGQMNVFRSQVFFVWAAHLHFAEHGIDVLD